MATPTSPRIIRKPEVLEQSGFSRSTLHTRIKQQLFVPPISLGDRAAGWIQSEVNAVLTAMISGKPKEEIRQLVATLTASRQHIEQEG